MKKVTCLFLMLGLAFSVCHGNARANQTFTGDISGGSHVRRTDGVNGETLTVTGRTGGDLNISGGTFTTAAPQTYTGGVVIVRDDNIRLYDTLSSSTPGSYKLHTPQSVEDAYRTGNTAQFAPLNNPTAIPAKEEVLNALAAARNMTFASQVNAWNIRADGNINVTGGSFDFTTTNTSTIRAGGMLNWSNASLLSAGGGGALTINAAGGINVESGSIRSEGFSADGPYAIGYDARGRLDRDRWTLGNYLYFQTDGDIVLGRQGSATGPEIYVGDGMVFFTNSTGGTAAGSLYLHSGSLTLEGKYRSTLNTGSMAQTIIDGGTLNVITADRINRNGLDSASMYMGDTTLESGVINLYNGQLGGAVTMNGGVINAMGDSAVNSGAKAVTVNGGVINLGERAFIGAIKGDSPALSPYVTSSASVSIGGNAVVNVKLGEPTNGSFTVGKNIGGIYTINGVSPTAINIASGATFNVLNPYLAGVGTTVVSGFAEAANGSVTLAPGITSGANPWYGAALRGSATGADLVLTTHAPAPLVRQMPGNSNVTGNADAFADLLVNGRNGWSDFSAAVVATGYDYAAGAELLRQAGGESVTANAYSIMSTVREMQKAARGRGFGALNADSGGSQDLGHGNRLWLNAVGATTDQDSANGRAGYSGHAAGLVAGFDHTFAGRYLAGVALGYARGHFESNDDLAEGSSDNWYASLYSSVNLDPLVLDADMFYAHASTDIDTRINGFAGSSGNIGADSFGGAVTASYVFAFNNGNTRLAPYAGIEYLGIDQQSWSDGGYLPREFDGDFSSLWTLPVGVKFSHAVSGEDWTFTPSLGLAYARDLNRFRPEASVSMPGMSTKIVSRGPNLDRNSLRGDVSLDFRKNDFSLSLKYNIDARAHYTSHGGTLGVAWSF